MGSSDIINREELKERLDNDMELFVELVDVFVNDSDKLINNIDEAISKGDSESIGKTAHTLKGAVSNFSAVKAYESSLALEKIGKSGEIDKAPGAFETVKKEIEILIKALQEMKNDKAL